MADITSEMVWKELGKQIFGVLGMVTPEGESRTSGIVYIIVDQKFYIGVRATAWKVRHIEKNPNVSMTATVPKRAPLMPWIKIPPGTITFAGTARVLETAEVSRKLLFELYHNLSKDKESMARSRLIEIVPKGDFVTYGVGVSLGNMRYPDRARGRAPVKAQA